MSCAVVLRYRLVAPHLHCILSSLCIITSLYICFGNLPCSPASCKCPPLTFFTWKSQVPIFCFAVWYRALGHLSQGQTTSAVLQCAPHSASSARKEPGRDPVHPQLWLGRKKAQGQSDTSPQSWLQFGTCPPKGDTDTWRLDVWRIKLLNCHGQH